MDRAYRETIVSPDAYGYGSRSLRDARATRNASLVRLICQRGHLIDRHTADGFTLAYRPNASKTWRCRRCGRAYPVTLERMLAEYRAAVERGDRVIALPLGKL